MNDVMDVVRLDLPCFRVRCRAARARGDRSRSRHVSPSYTRAIHWLPRTAKAQSSRTSTATASSISMQESPWWPPGIATLRWSRRFRSRRPA